MSEYIRQEAEKLLQGIFNQPDHKVDDRAARTFDIGSQIFDECIKYLRDKRWIEFLYDGRTTPNALGHLVLSYHVTPEGQIHLLKNKQARKKEAHRQLEERRMKNKERVLEEKMKRFLKVKELKDWLKGLLHGVAIAVIADLIIKVFF